VFTVGENGIGSISVRTMRQRWGGEFGAGAKLMRDDDLTLL
jgi:hypothetical protein